MYNKEFGKNLEERTKKFAIQILKLSSRMISTTENKTIKYQITKSGSGIGTNYREANRARSKADFKNKIKICESGASETVYWLEIILELKLVNDEKIQPVLKEANELLAIFSSIGKKFKL